MAKIFCFGDSITYGAWDEESMGWVQRVREKIHTWMHETGGYALLYNLGIPGETSDGLKARVASEFTARCATKTTEEPIFIFACGANDSAFMPSRQVFRVDEDVYAENMNEIVEWAKQHTSKIFLLNTTPLIERIAFRPIGKDTSRQNEWVERYNARLSDVAQSNAVPVVDVYGVFIKQGHETLFSKDGLHPNAAGHAMITDLVWSMLQPMLEGTTAK